MGGIRISCSVYDHRRVSRVRNSEGLRELKGGKEEQVPLRYSGLYAEKHNA